MARRQLYRDPVELKTARLWVQGQLLLALEAERSGHPFCTARLRLVKLLRFRLGGIQERVQAMLGAALVDENPAAQAELCDLLETLVHDVGIEAAARA